MIPTSTSGCRVTRHPDGTARPNTAGVCLGGGPLGNLRSAITDADAAATIDTAWRLGIRAFDTAPHYGLGLSEVRLGAALRSRPRDQFTISTKVGRVLEPTGTPLQRDAEFDVPATHRRRFDFGRDGIRASLESSLVRLGLDRVDVVYLHDPDDHLERAMTDGVAALAELRDEGVIGAFGVGMNHVAPLVRFAERTPIDRVMVAGRLTLLDQSATDGLLDACASRGIGIVAAGVFNSGILAQDTPTHDGQYDYRDAPEAIVERARRIQAICAEHAVSLREAALAYPRSFTEVDQLCVGAAHPTHVIEIASALDRDVPDALWADLIRADLLGPRARPSSPDRAHSKVNPDVQQST